MKIGQQIMRFGIKKLSIGVVSVAVGFAFIVPTGVSANEGNHGLKNEGSVSVVAKDSPVKENTDKKTGSIYYRGESYSYSINFRNKRSCYTWERKSRRRIISKRICCTS